MDGLRKRGQASDVDRIGTWFYMHAMAATCMQACVSMIDCHACVAGSGQKESSKVKFMSFTPTGMDAPQTHEKNWRRKEVTIQSQMAEPPATQQQKIQRRRPKEALRKEKQRPKEKPRPKERKPS